MTLLDIDVLEERVRAESVRSAVREAIACYRAGAYRSCIVATWIALVHDFVAKFRELAIHGDADAQKLVLEFDRIQRTRDTSAALKFEREVLDTALDKYELVSSQEHTELSRLLEDRNRFGHPNLNQDSEVLDATPELARTHLRNAVEHVLQRPPVQGKAALTQIQSIVDSTYFPRNLDDAVTVLSSTALVRAKKNVVRDFYLGCVTSVLREKPDAEVFEKRVSAACACRRIHPDVVDALSQERMQSTFDKTEDLSLGYLIVLVTRMPELMKYISPALKVRLSAFIKKLPENSLSVLNFASDLPFLEKDVCERLSEVTSYQLREFTQRAARKPSRMVIDRAISLLEESKSWDSSNAVASAISEKMMNQLTSQDATKILFCAKNGEVTYSFNFPPLVKALVEKGLLDWKDVKEVAEKFDVAPLSALLPD